ncbi:BTAD domain-containing putative transcriptional regulator [Amycolatopsis sp. NPDC049253]|uniref:BTAD domain-containing putative transcriptional regulator n=1 Tax=Amycolatopsis sp. NPDC049253 TaxID=3155274 RepID=UPI00343D31DF
MTPESVEPAPRPHRHRIAPPGVPTGSLGRPRLDRLLSDLFETYSVVEIVAAPGSGKTVQAQLYAAASGLPLAWLTLDKSDVSASALVFDLASALGDLAEGAAATMFSTLQGNGTPDEAAAILASTLGEHDCLLVIDDCHHIAGSADAASAVDTFLEYIAEPVRVLLLARDELPWPLQKRYVHGQIAQLGDATLNLSKQEVAAFVESSGAGPESVEQIFEQTGGWAAGVAFASRFGVGEEPNLRDLSTYFGRQVLDPLPEAEQRFLLDTSVTDAVTRDVAVALCGAEGNRLWSGLSARHLPATSRTADAIVCHSLFRTYLLRQLEDTQPERLRELRAAYARYLATVRQFDEATELWLALGDFDEAQRSAVEALPALYSRADWPVVKRWLDALGEDRVFEDPALIGASVRAVHDLRELEPARRLIRRMDREGRLRGAVEHDPGVLAVAAWAMHAHPHEALGLLDKYEGDASADVVRYMIDTTVSTREVTPPDVQGLAFVERGLSWGLFLQGRLGELARMGPADANGPILNPHVILAAAFRQDTAEADRMWLRIPPETRDRPHARFIEAMMDLTRQNHSGARENLRLALADSHRSGFSLEPVYETFAGYLLLLTDGPEPAIAQLRPVLDAMSRTGQTAYIEMTQCFLGLAYLRVDRVAEARLMLRDAVASMTRCRRELLLSLAAAGLSEATARAGDDEAAHENAELAYRVATDMGSFWALIQAVRLFPEIRRREAARDRGDTRWSRLVVAPSSDRTADGPHRPEPSTRRFELQPFGRGRDLYVDGVRANVGRTKLLELLACLALHPKGIDRFELQRRLFPDADQRSGGNHFRQVAHKLRLRTGIVLERQGSLVLVSPALGLIARDVESERLLAEASALPGPERRRRLLDGLAPVEGLYLEGSCLPWVEERRAHLTLVHEEARIELAMLHLELGEPELARAVCEQILESNRYSDPAYRVLADVERAVGSESSALAVYRRASDALAELGLQPGDARRLARGRHVPTGRPPATD